jgi:hypothetical protein
VDTDVPPVTGEIDRYRLANPASRTGNERDAGRAVCFPGQGCFLSLLPQQPKVASVATVSIIALRWAACKRQRLYSHCGSTAFGSCRVTPFAATISVHRA